MSVNVHFLPDDITIIAEAGEPILDVAERAGYLFPPAVCWVLVMLVRWN
jgi:hypothetical protein